jgi:class 3 adenylate cyclase/tetratricopeptide (TPR) repeat protein
MLSAAMVQHVKVSAWLGELELERYAGAFEANDVDMDILRDLTESDLSALGVQSVGHRRKLAVAIAALRVAEMSAAAGSRAERRQMTVMFCDLVGFTALSNLIDPEDLRAVVNEYHAIVLDQVRHNHGFVAKYMGDGVLIYFGYPQAHEDDPERAVRAGLGILAGLKGMRLQSGPLQARIGLATGRVVVGDMIGQGAAQEPSVVGETPNLAARLQSIARPNQMVIAASTRRMLGDEFHLLDLGEQDVKGIPGPVPAWAVLDLVEPANRFETTRRSQMATMAGRLSERDAMTGLRHRAWAGEGQVVVLSGDPGIGKSRLAAWFCDDSAGQPHLRISYQCSPAHQDSPLFPFIKRIRQTAGLTPDMDPATQLQRLEALILGIVAEPGGAVALIAAMIELQGEPLGLSPAQQRAETFAAFVQVMVAMAQQRPLLVLFEDMHWADATSLELLALMAARIRSLPVILVATTRPETRLWWQGLANVTLLALDRLEPDSMLAIVQNAATGACLSAEALQKIVVKAEGNPLFAEEITRTVVETGMLADTDTPRLGVPDTLHDLLMARLDSMGVAKEIAQIGAAIGREFTAPLLQQVCGQEDSVLGAALVRLQRAAVVYRRGEGAGATYVFKHALLQDAAYDSLLKSRRTELHRTIAEILGARRPDQPGAEPELVAQHYARAGLLAEAVGWWGQGIERALRRSAYPEALGHFRNVLPLIETLGETKIDLALLLKLQVSYGQVLIAVRGFAAPETSAAFVRANQLAMRIEDPLERYSIFYGLWSGHFVRGDMPAMAESAQAFLDDATSQPDLPNIGVAHRSYGVTRWYLGDYLTGQWHLERAFSLYEPERDRPLAFKFAQDAGVSAMNYLGYALWPLGEVDRACETMRKASELGIVMGHAGSIAYLHYYKSLFECIRLEPEQATPSLQALETVTQAHGLAFWNRAGLGLSGWVQCRRGNHEEGMDMIRRALAAHGEEGLGSMIPTVQFAQADVARSPAEVEVALDAVNDCLRRNGTDGYWLGAEMLRMRGELLLRGDRRDVDGAARAFREALAVSKSQRTRSFGLRAALSLARLEGGKAAGDLRTALDGFVDTQAFAEVGVARALLATLEG